MDIPIALAPLALVADSTATDTVAPGVLHHAFFLRAGPWAIHVLDIDRARCWTLQAVKAGSEAVGRARTSELLIAANSPATLVTGGVNADFFSFSPPGVPTGAMIHAGRVITGPGSRPVLAFDSAGRPWIGTLGVAGWVIAGQDTMPVEAWNRRSATGLAVFDRGYGSATDTSSGALRVTLAPTSSPMGDSSGGAVTIPGTGAVLSLDPRAPSDLRRRLVETAARRDHIRSEFGLVPFHPVEAVGGFPILVRDSVEVDELDQAGGTGFGPVRHPRTLVGLTASGRRILLVTVDGRQEGYSAGMTLRESARLLLELGATEGLNLDGGGSTTMVRRRSVRGRPGFEIVNRPSDKEGERPVANALAVTGACR